MKAEELKQKAEAWLVNNLHSTEQDYAKAYIAGATENGIKWHKVADGDFPKVTGDYITNIGMLTYDYYGNNIYKWHTPFCEVCDYGDEVGDDEVIAWCEIPQFKG